MKKLIAVILLSLLSSSVFAKDSAIPVYLINLIPKAEGLEGRLKKVDWLRNLSKDNKGSSVILAVSLVKKPTSGGTAAGVTSAVLAGGTLGLIPVVSNEDIYVKYEVLVQRFVVAEYIFSSNFSKTQNMWTIDFSKAVEGPALDWLLSTVSELEIKMRRDKVIQNLKKEYKLYFGDI